eukprot:9234152-Prorocentrum_lima.AAC.1
MGFVTSGVMRGHPMSTTLSTFALGGWVNMCLQIVRPQNLTLFADDVGLGGVVGAFAAQLTVQTM